jgi:hypothetical protein
MSKELSSVERRDTNKCNTWTEYKKIWMVVMADHQAFSVSGCNVHPQAFHCHRGRRSEQMDKQEVATATCPTSIFHLLAIASNLLMKSYASKRRRQISVAIHHDS